MDISSTRHLGHRRRVCESGEDDSGNLFASSFIRKDDPPPVVGSLSTMSVKKSGLGLLNPFASAQENYLRSTRGRAELVQAVTGGGEFSNAKHLHTLSEEQNEGKKYQDVAYKYRIKGLLSDLKSTDKPLLLLTKSTDDWLSVPETVVSRTLSQSSVLLVETP